jgi:hypothetical protein
LTKIVDYRCQLVAQSVPGVRESLDRALSAAGYCLPQRDAGGLHLLGQPFQQRVDRFGRALSRLGCNAAQRVGGIGDLRAQLPGQRAQCAHWVRRAAVDGGDKLVRTPGQQGRKAGHLLVEGMHRALADADDSRRDILAPLAEGGHQVGAPSLDDLAQVVDLRSDRAGDAGASRRPDRLGFRRRARQNFAHRLNASGKALIDGLGVAVRRLRQVGQAHINDACALISGLGQGGQARVKDLRALPGRVGDRDLMGVERRADRRLVHVQHCRDLLRVFTHLVFQFRPTGVEAPAQVLHGRNDLLLELIDARSERVRDVFDPASQCPVDVSGDVRQCLCQFFGPPLQRLADFSRFGAHAFCDFPAAVAKRFRGFEGASGQGLGKRPAALRERVFNPHEQAFEG